MHGLKPLGVANSGEIEFERDFNNKSLAYEVVLVGGVERLFEDQRSSSLKDSNGLSPNNCIKFLDAAIEIGNSLFSTK